MLICFRQLSRCFWLAVHMSYARLRQVGARMGCAGRSLSGLRFHTVLLFIFLVQSLGQQLLLSLIIKSASLYRTCMS